MASTNNISLQADPSEFEMPYGKYGGRPLCEIPTQYLRWVYRDWNFALLPELQRTMRRTWVYRQTRRSGPVHPRPNLQPHYGVPTTYYSPGCSRS